MAEYYSLLTIDGQDKVAAFAGGGSPITLATLKVGDGGGAVVEPNENQVDLVNVVASVAVASVAVQAGGIMVVEAILADSIGGFTIREAGVFDSTGDLIAVAKMPPTFKPGPSSGAAAEMTIRLVIDFGNSGAVTVDVVSSDLVSNPRLLRMPFISVESITTATPPGSPAQGATYVVAASPTGAWTGHTTEFAQFDGTGWVFRASVKGTIVHAIDSGEYWRKTDSGWASFKADATNYGIVKRATQAFMSAGTDAETFITPALLQFINATSDDMLAGTDDIKFVSPADVRAIRASDAECLAGTEDRKWVSPKGLKAVIDALKGGVSTTYDTLKKIADALNAHISVFNSHNHNSLYSPLGHNHDGVYAFANHTHGGYRLNSTHSISHTLGSTGGAGVGAYSMSGDLKPLGYTPPAGAIAVVIGTSGTDAFSATANLSGSSVYLSGYQLGNGGTAAALVGIFVPF